MKSRLVAVALLAVALSLATRQASAQAGVWWYVPDYVYYPNYYGYGPTVVPGSGYVGPFGYVPGISAYGYGWGPSLGFDGFYGQARLAEGLGQYNRDTAAAARELAEARAVEAQTRAQQVRDFWEARRLREDFRREQRAQRRNRPPAAPLALPRPTAEELDRASGAIRWPTLLQEAAYAQRRQEVERLFAVRAKTGKGGEGTLNYLEIRSAVGQVRDLLEAHVAQIDAATWITANQFLSRLVNEAREPPGNPAEDAAAKAEP